MGARLAATWIVLLLGAESSALADPPPTTPPSPVASAPPAPAPPRSRSPFELRLDVDFPLLAAGLVLWTAPFALTTNELQGPTCDPCDRSHVNAFDRLSIPLQVAGAGTTAAVLLYALPPIFFTIRLIDYGIGNWRGYLTDAVVVAESVVTSGVLDEIVRRSVRRPRPYMYEAGVYPDQRSGVEATLSFYSGHTSASFAFTTATSYAFMLRHPGSKWNWLVWIGLMGFSSAQGVLRVLSGDHFPTDVIVGAVVGTGIGLIVPTLHRRHSALDSPLLSSLSLVPMQIDGGGMLSLAGSL